MKSNTAPLNSLNPQNSFLYQPQWCFSALQRTPPTQEKMPVIALTCLIQILEFLDTEDISFFPNP